jgi:hypothetical protein
VRFGDAAEVSRLGYHVIRNRGAAETDSSIVHSKTCPRPTVTILPQMNSQESESGPRSVKRRRIQIACIQCRDRKTRCDGVRPVCGTCGRRGKAGACTYDQDGPPTLQYSARSPTTGTVADVIVQARSGCRRPPQATGGSYP